ncbi:MAG: ABC transporter ATP-binding protein [Candidatus Omnitrophica bacterium]|nr:ABC transporter ATP-binding protein [Candidatus Omnitrophota bacterium]
MKLILIAHKYLKRYPALTLVTLCSIVIASLFEGASFGMLIPLIQSMVQKGPNILEKIPLLGNIAVFHTSTDKMMPVFFILMLLFLLLLVKNIFIYVSNVLIAKLRFGIIKDLRTALMGNLLGYDAKYFDSAKTGYIIANMTTETERIGNFVMSVLQFVALSGRVGTYLVLLFLISWKASIGIFLLMAFILIPIELIMGKLKKIGKLVSRCVAEYNYKLTEILGGMAVIRTLGTGAVEREAFNAACENSSDSQYLANKYIHLIIPLSEVGVFGLLTLFFFIFINVAEISLASTFPFIATYFLILGRALTQLNSVNSQRSDAMSLLAAFANYEYINNPADKKTIKSGSRLIKTFSDSIDFAGVYFSYTDGNPVLKDINFSIPKGKITALVGASGAGKSTIVNLILRFYDVDSGQILVDGLNLKDLALSKWRGKIGFVSQDIFIFNNTLKNNISYGCDDAKDEDIVRAAKASYAHDFIVNMPDGYDTLLGERGVTLSGGEKQRISIARSVMHNPEILILDEATSSLDTETERLITEAINKLARGRTVIAIAHRLSTILHADNIVVLDKGRVVESGKHEDLLAKEGMYKKLFDMQFTI